MKVLKIVIIVVLIAIAFIIGMMWLASRTKTENISTSVPYKSVVGTTVVTKQICYIAKNRKASVNQNPYLIKMTSRYFGDEVKEVYTLPLGTSLIIEEAKAFISPFSTLQRKYILGKVTVKELNKTVSFEMAWDPSDAGYNQDYLATRNDLMPWHNEILSRKYYLEGVIDSSFYPAQIKDPEVAARFRNTTYYTTSVWENKVTADYTTENTKYESDWNMGYIDEKQFSIRVLVPKDEITEFQLYEVFPELDVSLDKIVFSNELTLSPNYYTLVAIKFMGKMNETGQEYSYYNKEQFLGVASALINYDLNGQKIDHHLLSSEMASDSTELKKSMVADTHIKTEEKKNDSTITTEFEITELGEIVLKGN